jgi:hypothetical protein
MKKKAFKIPALITIAFAFSFIMFSAAYFIDLPSEQVSIESSDSLQQRPYERKKIKRDATIIKTPYKLIPQQLLQPKSFDLSYRNQLKS